MTIINPNHEDRFGSPGSSISSFRVIAVLVLSVMVLVAGAVFVRLNDMETRHLHSRELEIQRAALVQFPIVSKFVRVFPEASFFSALPDAGNHNESYVVFLEDRQVFVSCSLPIADVDEAGRVVFDGFPTINIYRLNFEGHSAWSEVVDELTEEDLDAILEVRDGFVLEKAATD